MNFQNVSNRAIYSLVLRTPEHLDLLHHNSAWRRTVWDNLMKGNTSEEKDMDYATYILELVEDKEALPLDVLDIIFQRF